MAAAFWTCAGLVVYTYLLYPVLLWLMTFWRRPPLYADGACPPLSLVVAAYNEAEFITDKLENALALDYPRQQLQIIVASDCSDDGTDALVERFGERGVTLVRLPERSGKTAAQNAAARVASGEILVFSDANSIYDSGALRELVRPFSDAEVGCVCGELRYLNPEEQGAGKGEGFYWRYEQFLKRRESLLGSLVGANGSIYAVRRELFEELAPEVISDLILPMRVKRGGARVVYQPEAAATEFTPKQFVAEFRRRARIVARSAYGLSTQPGVLNPWSSGLFAIQVWSHKVVRWLVPVFMIVAFTASGALYAQQPYGALFAAQATFYILAVLGLLSPATLGRFGLFYIPAYFSAINAGALLGIWGFVAGKRYRVWQPVQRAK